MTTPSLKQKLVSPKARLFFACLSGVLLSIGMYLFTSQTPSIFELSFTEHSEMLGKDAGSVIPASCNSMPPTSHFAGDCPVVVQTNLSSSNIVLTINNTITGHYLYQNGNYYTHDSITATYTSGPATTRCALTATGYFQWLSPNASISVTGPYNTPVAWSLRCTDGIFVTQISSFTVVNTTAPYSTVYEPPN